MASSSGSSRIALVDSGPTFEVWRGPLGAMRLDWNRTGALRMTNVGHGYGEFAEGIVRKSDELAKSTGALWTVCDWHELQTYDSAFRTDHAKILMQHMSVWKGAYVITQSKLVGMGLAVANLGLGGRIKTYSSRAEFDAFVKKLGFQPCPSLK